jgi:phosphoglycerate kinase
MDKLTVRDIDVSGKRVLVRVDFNVPMNEKTQVITDDSRIKASLPTIQYLVERGAKIILCSHLGRPDGKVVESQRMGVVGQRLSELLGKPVTTVPDCIGPEVEKAAASLKAGEILLLENLRFHPEEEKNDAGFARALAGLADVYVNDAFGTAHRAHASTAGVTKYLPAVSGFLMEKELEHLGNIIENPARPFACLVGGAKVSDKVKVLENIMGKMDFLLIGGGMAATFLKVKGMQVGKSLVEEDRMDTAARLMERATKAGVNLVLPIDVVVATEISAEATALVAPVQRIQPDQRIVDIGPVTVGAFADRLRTCKTIFWNGPMGINEITQFAQATLVLARTLAGLKATTVIGGGSTSDAVTNMGLADKMTFVSTGGGASLELLGGQKLPGVEALMDKNSKH